MVSAVVFSRTKHPKFAKRMDSEALQEHYEKLADECEANKDQLVFRNFQIRPLHVQTIVKIRRTISLPRFYPTFSVHNLSCDEYTHFLVWIAMIASCQWLNPKHHVWLVKKHKELKELNLWILNDLDFWGFFKNKSHFLFPCFLVFSFFLFLNILSRLCTDKGWRCGGKS